MAVDQETRVTQTETEGVTETGEVVKQRTSKVENSAGSKTTITNLVWYVYGLVAVLLGLRFILKLFGANSASGFVDFVYSITGVLSAPFDAVFGVTTATAGETESVFEPSIIVAVIVYGLIAWGIAKLLTLNEAR